MVLLFINNNIIIFCIKLKKINNPKVFHIATHGFFKSEENDVASQDLITSELVNNPLLRSGLLLTGAGDILNVTDYNFNINEAKHLLIYIGV